MTEASFDSVWDAIEDTAADAASMKARAGIMIAIQQEIERWAIPRREAAVRLGVTGPRLDELLQGKINSFTLDALADLARAAGLEVAWSVKTRAA